MKTQNLKIQMEPIDLASSCIPVLYVILHI